MEALPDAGDSTVECGQQLRQMAKRVETVKSRAGNGEGMKRPSE